MLLGAGTGYTARSEGGEVTHTHYLDNAYAKIGHEYYRNSIAYEEKGKWWYTGSNSIKRFSTNEISQTNESWDYSGTALAGSTNPTSSLSPYRAVYMYKRTA